MSNNKLLNYNECYFDQIDTPAKAYFLGLTLADGSVNKYWYEKTEKFLYRFKLALHPIDEKIIYRLSEEINAAVKYETQKTKKRVEPYKTVKVEIRNKHLVETLINNFGGANKPERVKYEVPKHLKSHFIRGYFDGDGSLSKTKKNDRIAGHQWEIGISGHEVVLSEIIKDAGIEVNITKDKSVKRVRIRKKKDIHKFIEYIYSDIDANEQLPLFIERKYEKCKEFLGEIACLK